MVEKKKDEQRIFHYVYIKKSEKLVALRGAEWSFGFDVSGGATKES